MQACGIFVCRALLIEVSCYHLRYQVSVHSYEWLFSAGGKHRITSPQRQHRTSRGSSAKNSPSAARHAKRNAGLVQSPSSSRPPVVMQKSDVHSPHLSHQQPSSSLIAHPIITVSPNSQRLAVSIETHKDNASSSSESA